MYKKLLPVLAILSQLTAAHAGVTGDILALNHAFRQNDDVSVDRYLGKALKQLPDNPSLINQAIMSAVFEQDLDKAAGFVEELDKLSPDSQTSYLVKLAVALNENNLDGVYTEVKGIPYLDDELVRAWQVAAKAGKAVDAFAILEDASKAQPALKPIYDYEKALMLAAIDKDYNGAAKIISGEDNPLYLNDASFFGHVAMKILGGDDSYLAQIEKQFGGQEAWPFALRQIVDDAENGKINDNVNFKNPQNALVEYIAFVLNQSREAGLPRDTERFFATLLPTMVPENDLYRLDLLSYLYGEEEYDDVLKFADQFQKNSAYALDQNIFKFASLMQSGKTAQARSLLEKSKGDALDELQFQAESYRQLEQYDDAFAIFQKILANKSLSDSRRAQMSFYAAICAEQSDKWPQAEAYFRVAIGLEPDDAQVLNYLGYSLVDRGINIEEGLELVERAVKLDPSQAYIQDSLGWAYFKVGDFQKALGPLELASSSMAADPVVNAHLGDVYWKLGREREAMYQWERAHKFLSEDKPDLKISELEDRLANGLPD